MPQTSTGTPGTNIVAQCSVPADGDFVTGAGLKTAFDPTNDDLATIKSGNCAIAGIKTFSAAPDFDAGATVAQAQAITAEGTGATLAGVWTFERCPLLSAGPSVSITNATNATPIVITAAGHGLVDGQQVVIASVGGNIAANGTWVADVLSSSTFGLVGSAGSGGYTAATGTMQATAEVGFSAPRTTTRTLHNLWNDGNVFTNSAWAGDVSGVFAAINGSPTTQIQHFGYEIDVPQGANIVSATIYMQPNGGHAAFPGGKPATLPTVKIYRFTLATGALTALATTTDPNTGSAGAYETYSGITATIGTDEFADHSRFRYTLVLATESGANALDGTRVFAGTVTFASSFLEQV